MDIHIYVSLYLLLFWDIYSCSLFSPLLLVLFHIVIYFCCSNNKLQLYSIYFDEMMRSGRYKIGRSGDHIFLFNDINHSWYIMVDLCTYDGIDQLQNIFISIVVLLCPCSIMLFNNN